MIKLLSLTIVLLLTGCDLPEPPPEVETKDRIYFFADTHGLCFAALDIYTSSGNKITSIAYVGEKHQRLCGQPTRDRVQCSSSVNE